MLTDDPQVSRARSAVQSRSFWISVVTTELLWETRRWSRASGKHLSESRVGANKLMFSVTDEVA